MRRSPSEEWLRTHLIEQGLLVPDTEQDGWARNLRVDSTYLDHEPSEPIIIVHRWVPIWQQGGFQARVNAKRNLRRAAFRWWLREERDLTTVALEVEVSAGRKKT